jgi:predicted Zn-dependent peptidase
MTRDDLMHYRHYYVPNNATLVIAGDVDTRDALDRSSGSSVRFPAQPIQRASGSLNCRSSASGASVRAARHDRVYEGGRHAPAATDPDFFPMLVLDAVLTGAKGSTPGPASGWRPQRKSRFYTALVEHGIAATVSGPCSTAQPFLYTVSLAAMQGVHLPELESA